MKVLVTGSSGHLGEALVRRLFERGDDVVGIDVLPSPQTTIVGSISDRSLVTACMKGVDAVVHTATLHKPHVATHTNQQFIDVNIVGTETLLQAAIENSVKSFVFTSTTSTFGNALSPQGATSAVWVTEDLTPIPKNIYGVTKCAAEDLCQLAHLNHGLSCVVLKTSRFFPEDDDMKHTMAEYSQDNIKAIEFLNRRVDIEDVVSAHEMAISRASRIGFDRFIISATTPFQPSDCDLLTKDPSKVLRRYFPEFEGVFRGRGWKMFPSLGRVYVNQHAREKLGWQPKIDFAEILRRLQDKRQMFSDVTYRIGTKGYHR